MEWPSGEAKVCKTLHTGSIPVSTSKSSREDARAISSAGERFPDTEEVTGSIPVSRTETPRVSNADVAQLVAHHLAKVRVASSSLVIRSGTSLL